MFISVYIVLPCFGKIMSLMPSCIGFLLWMYWHYYCMEAPNLIYLLLSVAWKTLKASSTMWRLCNNSNFSQRRGYVQCLASHHTTTLAVMGRYIQMCNWKAQIDEWISSRVSWHVVVNWYALQYANNHSTTTFCHIRSETECNFDWAAALLYFSPLLYFSQWQRAMLIKLFLLTSKPWLEIKKISKF